MTKKEKKGDMVSTRSTGETAAGTQNLKICT